MFKNEFKIGDKKVGPYQKPFVIAEMSGNHNQDLNRAIRIVEEAARCGADAIKLQTYTADTMTLNLKDKGFFIDDENSLWKGKTLYELYKNAYTPWEWHQPIMDRAKQLGILCFSSPFDPTSVEFLSSLNVPCYKVASFEMTYVPLVKKIAKLGKPMIVSTGLASLAEIAETVEVIQKNGCTELVLLKCTSSYPASPENTNLRTIPNLRENFGSLVGLSDHTMGVGASVASIALGACVIEKHFTLDRSEGGLDSAFSLEPAELKSLVIEVERAWLALGKIHFGASAEEQTSYQHRRSIYVVKDIREGELFSEQNIRCIRPGHGLETKYYEDILGKPSISPLSTGTPMKLDYVKGFGS